MIVVFDTNIWLSQLGLRSPTASGVRFFLRHNNYRVALPEIVRMEVEINLRNDLMAFISDVKDSHTQLLTVFQNLPTVKLPTESEVEAIIPELFASIGVEVIHVPFSMESATSSFLKTIHKVQPSNNSQQFKDGVLWANCLSLLDTDDVTLVTADKAFYAGNNYNHGLASNLQKEASLHSHKLRIVETLPKLLDALPKSVPFNEDKLVAAALIAAESNIAHYVADQFELGVPTSITRSLFATENTGKIFFECSIAIPCHDVSGLNRTDAVLTISVDGVYAWETEDFGTVGMIETKFRFRDENDEEVERKGVWLRTAGVGVGRGMVTSIIRERLHE